MKKSRDQISNASIRPVGVHLVNHLQGWGQGGTKIRQRRAGKRKEQGNANWGPASQEGNPQGARCPYLKNIRWHFPSCKRKFLEDFQTTLWVIHVSEGSPVPKTCGWIEPASLWAKSSLYHCRKQEEAGKGVGPCWSRLSLDHWQEALCTTQGLHISPSQ